jgi:hypothetical protein
MEWGTQAADKKKPPGIAPAADRLAPGDAYLQVMFDGSMSPSGL